MMAHTRLAVPALDNVRCRAVTMQQSRDKKIHQNRCLTRSRGNGYACKNRDTFGNSVLYSVRASDL
jgi:hypothetical protein